MTKTHLKCAIIGGLIVFIWGIFSWMVFPWHKQCFNKFSDQKEVAAAIRANAPVEGIYILPNTLGYNDKTSHGEMKQGMEMMKQGPFMFAVVKPDGTGRIGLRPFIFQLIIQIIGAFLLTWMMMQAKGITYGKTVAFSAIFGLSIGVIGLLPEWNWWGFAGGYVLINIVDLVIGWTLAGLAIGKLRRK